MTPNRCSVSRRECIFKTGPRKRRRRDKLSVRRSFSVMKSVIKQLTMFTDQAPGRH